MFLPRPGLTATGHAWEHLHRPARKGERKGNKGEWGRVRNGLRANQAISWSRLQRRLEGPGSGKRWLPHLPPQTQILKTRTVSPPFLSNNAYLSEKPTQKARLCHLPSRSAGQVGQMGDDCLWRDWEWVLRQGAGQGLVHDHRGREGGREAKALDPLGLFTFAPVQLSRLCFSQQTSTFLSGSCQFFFPRWAMNLPRVSKQTVERARAFEPEENLGGSRPSHWLVVKPWAGLRRAWISGPSSVMWREQYLPSFPHRVVRKITWENGCEFLLKLQILDKYKGLLFLDSIDFLNRTKLCVAGWSSYVINNQEKCSGSWNNFTSLLAPMKGHWL